MFPLIKELQKVGRPKLVCCVKPNLPGPPLGGLNDYEYKENFKAILQEQEALQTGDVPLMMEVQADNFVLTYAGRKYSKEQFPSAFEDIWLKVNHAFPQESGQSCIQDLVDGNTLKNPSLSVTTKAVYEVKTFVIHYISPHGIPFKHFHLQWEETTFVTAEIVGPTHSGVLLNVLKNGKFLLANLELKREGDFYQTIRFRALTILDFTFFSAASPPSEGPAGPAGKTPEKPGIELTDEQKTEVSSYLSEILNSTSTIEAQAKAKGQQWKNYGRQFYQEQTGASDMEMQVLISKGNT